MIYCKCRNIFYTAIIKKKKNEVLSVRQYLCHRSCIAYEPARNIYHFLRWLHKKRIFSRVYLYTYIVCNVRTNPKEMNTGDRYHAAYWWTSAEFAEPYRNSLHTMNFSIHEGSHFLPWCEIFPTLQGKQTVLREPRRKYDSRDVS